MGVMGHSTVEGGRYGGDGSLNSGRGEVWG